MNEPIEPRVSAAQEQELSLFPAALRSLLNAELAAGNSIVEVGHTHPAPPSGAYVMLANQVTTRPRESAEGINFYERNGSHHCGEFADLDRRYFILEVPCPDDSYPDMDAIRERLAGSSFELNTAAAQAEQVLLARFNDSREMNYERWREGIGYDIEAMLGLSPPLRESIEQSLIPAKDWRDVEALVALGTPRAEQALRVALQSVDVELRLAVMSRAPQLVDPAKRLESVLMALETAVAFGGLSATLDQVEEFHPPAVVESLFRGLLHRTGDVAYHYATALAVIHGKIPNRWDWSLRPKLLAFNTTDMTERREAFLMLYDLLKDSPTFNLPAVDEMARSLRNARASGTPD